MQNSIYEIDLHGLSMSEAKMILDEVFEYLHDHPEIRKLQIVVGIGTGSESGPVLPAYVGNYLTEKSYSHTNLFGVLHIDLA